ncbi:MAG: HEAT repeat domain-containing protein [bacterium]
MFKVKKVLGFLVVLSMVIGGGTVLQAMGGEPAKEKSQVKETTLEEQGKNESKIVDRQKALEKRRAEIREKLREECRMEGVSKEKIEKEVEFRLGLIEDKVDLLEIPKIIKEIKTKMKEETLYPLTHEDMSITYVGLSRDPKAIPVLIEVLKNYKTTGARSAEARRDSAEALGQIGNKSAIPSLIEALEDKDILVCSTVAKVLVALGEKTKSLPVLISLAKGENMDKWSIDLSGYGDFTSDELKKVIDKTKKTIRYKALRDLGEIGNEKAISVIKELSKDEDQNIQYIANRILKRLGIEGSKK